MPDQPSRPLRVLPPLPRDDLFDPGCVFPAEELRHRILSLFWRDCCCPPYFNRTPAPVFELDPDSAGRTEAPPRPLAVWWLTPAGIADTPDGPGGATRHEPERVSLRRAAHARPRYDFRLWASPFDVEMTFHRSALATLGHRTRLFAQPDRRLRVLTRSEWWAG